MARLPLWSRGGLVLLLSCAAFAAEPPKPDAGKLAQQLASPERDVRRDAVYQLSKIGAAAKPALPALIVALDDADKQVWTGAMNAIANLGPDGAEAIPALIQGLDKGNGKTGRDRERQQALVRTAYALAKIGAAAVPPLTEALADASTYRRAGAARSLADFGPLAASAAPALVKNIGHGDEMLRRETVEALSQIGTPALPALLGVLETGDEKARQGAVTALGQIGRPAASAQPAILTLLDKETTVPVRAAAYLALARLGGTPETVIPVLMKGILNDEADVRHAAINGLLSDKALTAQAVPALTVSLRDPAVSTRTRSALVLGRIGGAAQKAVPALIECARREPKEAAYPDALAQIGPPAIPPLIEEIGSSKAPPADREWIFTSLRGMGSPALGPLTAALASPAAKVRAGAASALAGMSINSPAAVKSILALLSDKDPSVRAAALRAVSTLRSEQETVLTKAESALSDPDPQVRRAAASTLAAMGAVAKLGIEGLLELIQDPDPTSQKNTLQALGTLGAGAKRAVPLLLPKLDNADLRLSVIDTLGLIGEDAQPAVPKLIEFVQKGPEDARLASLRALQGIGPAALPALPALYEVMKNPDRDIRGQAFKAVGRIEPDADKVLELALELIKDQNGSMRRAAAAVLKRFGDQAQPAVPALIDMLARDVDKPVALETLRGMKVHSVELLTQKLEDRSTMIRTFACEALGKLGAEASDAIPTLQRRAQYDIDPVRSAAKKAIEQIMKK